MYISEAELKLRKHRQNLRQAQMALNDARRDNPLAVPKAAEMMLNALTRAWNAQERVKNSRRMREARIDELLTA